MNVYVTEKMMKSRQAEIERTSNESWKHQHGKRRWKLLSFLGIFKTEGTERTGKKNYEECLEC